MNRTLLILPLAALALGILYLERAQRTPPPDSVAPSPLAVETVAPHPTLPAITLSDPLAHRKIHDAPGPHPPGENPYAKKPKGTIIEFQVVGGLAVAYGDLLLGKPEAGFQGTQGHYEAPRVQLWERPEIPYIISADLPDPKRVERAIEYLHQNTPLRFVPYSGQKDAIAFQVGTEHCMSSLGRTGGIQAILLSPGCGSQEILHEIMHALGFVHEQPRPDRDRYVEILWPNIDQRHHPQFAIVPDEFMEAQRDSPFDFQSIMLYGPSTFAIRPDQFSMRSLGAAPFAPVQQGLSGIDLKRINRLYNLYE